MKYEDLIILLPCHSLEDFPTHHEGDDAAGLLAGWTALWHPALIANAQAMPRWFRASSPPQDLKNRLIVVPGVSLPELPADFSQRAEQNDACLICESTRRTKILEQALARLDPADCEVDSDLAADFLALGYCYLQVELLTRQMRYSSNLDEIHFQDQLLTAAKSACSGDLETARERLTACFDTLAQERDHYYPVDACVLDLTLVASTTLGRPLREQLDAAVPTNLLLSAELLEQMAEKEPDTLAALKRGLEEKRVGLIGGEYHERRLPLLSCESIRHELLQGLARYEALLGCRPRVFGRWRFGFTPMLPQILHKCGFLGVIHATMDEGGFPEGTQSKIRWEGCDGTTVDAIARPPLDANRPASYLNYAIKMGEAMDMDHVASVCLAHWPGQISDGYQDLRRTSRYGSALGKFTLVDAYFNETDMPVHQDRFRLDQYRAAYLKQAVAEERPDPISSCMRYWQRRESAEAAQTIETLTQLVAGRRETPDGEAEIAQCLHAIEAGGDEEQSAGETPPAGETQPAGETPPAAERVRQVAVARFADRLPRYDQPAQTGYLVVNPHSFVRRLGVEMPRLTSLPAIEGPVYAAAATADNRYVVVDVPPNGFVWIAPAETKPSRSHNDPPMAEDCLLRNEFFEVLIDPATGCLRAIREYHSRNNRMSQQLGLRLGAPRARSKDLPAEDQVAQMYSVMVADSVKTTLSTPVVAEIVARGRLCDQQGNDVARFQQTYRLWRGSRVLQLEIDLEPGRDCQPAAWDSYYAARFAWASEASDLRRGINLTRHPSSAKRFEAPLYVELDDGSARTTILTGGLPFHRRIGMRMLDSLLVTRGESCRHFRLGIGVELKNPLQEALALHSPADTVFQTAAPPTPHTSGWLFHLDARNVMATHWEPLLEDSTTKGFRVRLLETMGRSGQLTLSAFRPIGHARERSLDGAPMNDCALDDGCVKLRMAAHQWTEVEAHW